MGGDQNSSASFPLGVEVSPLILNLKFTLSVVEGKGALPLPRCHFRATLFPVILVLDTGIQGICVGGGEYGERR